MTYPSLLERNYYRAQPHSLMTDSEILKILNHLLISQLPLHIRIADFLSPLAQQKGVAHLEEIRPQSILIRFENIIPFHSDQKEVQMDFEYLRKRASVKTKIISWQGSLCELARPQFFQFSNRRRNPRINHLKSDFSSEFRGSMSFKAGGEAQTINQCLVHEISQLGLSILLPADTSSLHSGMAIDEIVIARDQYPCFRSRGIVSRIFSNQNPQYSYFPSSLVVLFREELKNEWNAQQIESLLRQNLTSSMKLDFDHPLFPETHMTAKLVAANSDHLLLTCDEQEMPMIPGLEISKACFQLETEKLWLDLKLLTTHIQRQAQEKSLVMEVQVQNDFENKAEVLRSFLFK